MPGGASAEGIEGILDGLGDSSWTRKEEALRTATARFAAGDLDEAAEARLARPIIEAAKDAKWEVRKAVALALGECRHFDSKSVQHVLRGLAGDSNRWVSQAADRAIRRLRSREQRAREWALTGDTQDPTLQHIATRIREIGLRSMTPARIYDLAMEIGEQAYRELAADTAHEIRTLLTPFEGWLAELRRNLAARGASDDTSERYLDAALGRLRQIQLVTENLRAYSSPSDADFGPVDVAALVQDAVATGSEPAVQGSTSPTIGRVIEVPQGLIIDGVRERLRQAIANLVANACQAMPDGGTLTVRARPVGGDHVELTVADTGHGMSPEMIEQARVRFRTTRRDEGGTGLGLPIAERIVGHDHRGELSIDSTVGKGTTVTIVLPVRHRSDEG
jgi:signal transduction histidine kinase